MKKRYIWFERKNARVAETCVRPEEHATTVVGNTIISDKRGESVLTGTRCIRIEIIIIIITWRSPGPVGRSRRCLSRARFCGPPSSSGSQTRRDSYVCCGEGDTICMGGVGDRSRAAAAAAAGAPSHQSNGSVERCVYAVLVVVVVVAAAAPPRPALRIPASVRTIFALCRRFPLRGPRYTSIIIIITIITTTIKTQRYTFFSFRWPPSAVFSIHGDYLSTW